MQIAAARPTAATAPSAPPAAWAARQLGSVDYTATLVFEELVDTPDDPENSWRQDDQVLWSEHGTSGIRTAGVLGAKEGYATLTEATKALRELTDDGVSDIEEEDALATHGSAGLASAKAAAVLEHAGRFYGYQLDRDFTGTEAFENEPQVEDTALYNGMAYGVTLAARPDTSPELRAIVDGWSGLWLLGR
jgi:hypothetical protein